jgi:ABC-type sugar transport system substrate-binding protein
MRRTIIPLMLILTAVILVFAGCAQPAPETPTTPTAPTTPTTPTTPTAPTEPTTPTLQIPTTASGHPLYAPELANLNPFGENLAKKPDGTPYQFAITYLFLACDPVMNYNGIAHSLLQRAGGEVEYFDANFDAEVQMAYIEDLITVPGKMKDGIIINAVNEHALVPAVEAATAAGLPCFAYDIKIYTDDLIALVWRDFTGVRGTGSDVVGQFFVDLAERENKQLNIYEVWGEMTMETAHARHEGFHKAVDGHPLITVTESPDTHWSADLSAQFIMDAFTANPELNAVYQHGAGCSGIMEGLRGIDRLYSIGEPDHVVVGTNDSDMSARELMEDGYLDAYLTHGGWHLMDGIVKQMLTYVCTGKTDLVEKEVLMPTFLVTYDNHETEFFFGALSYPMMPANEWDKWPVLDMTSIGIETPTEDMKLAGY